ncbi:TetR/AcrR family transcriptional regulator [Phytomonospora endophytica]|uniref:AcrR family transcriptional regulator n=1 Tax=Phytomonospora endophytica TaxID=714109 RepID=A0A841FDQ7_9ACTN|nr:TetR/AcrR family transcriptional regulator [Phytomonospora endophytica]MBB6033605.1 AcrR family transcriptional regulator [Phytomonospora endophytica]GIG64880.1 TetR family transcriptional regulator [Phytomonospora endophytica]
MRADARRNRARILQAAVEVFGAKGTSASTEEVARLAGVGIATVFRHFPTKEHLLRAVTALDLDEVAEQAADALATEDAAVAFVAVFSGLAEHVSTALLVDILTDGTESGTEEPVRVWWSALGMLLSRAQATGAIRADVTGAETIALLLGVCRAATSNSWPPETRRTALRVVFDGLRTSPSTPHDERERS